MLKNINNKALLWINLILKLLDIGTTVYLVKMYSISIETNPLIKYFMENYGLIPTMIGIMLCYTMAVGYLYKKSRRKLLFVVIAFMAIVVIVNTISILM